MRIIAQHDDGTEIDITEGVQIAYDVVVHSMDWGSGFLDTEEVDAIVNLARAARFPDFERIFNDVQERRAAEERGQALREEELRKRAEADTEAAAHQQEVIARMREKFPELRNSDPAYVWRRYQLLRRSRPSASLLTFLDTGRPTSL